MLSPSETVKPSPQDQPDRAEFDTLKALVDEVLDDLKAEDISYTDMRGRSPLTDAMVVASGRSTRHVKSMAGKLMEKAKHAGFQPVGMEGEQGGEWILLDLNDIIVHLMLPSTRAFYNLEKLWSVSEQQRAESSG